MFACTHLPGVLGTACKRRWSNGAFKSAMHRVVTTSGQHRYSTALFTEPNYDALVEPLPSCCSADNPPRQDFGKHSPTRPRGVQEDGRQSYAD